MTQTQTYPAAEGIARAIQTLKRAHATKRPGDRCVDDTVVTATVIDVDALRRAHIGEELATDEVCLNPAWDNALFCHREKYSDGSGWYTNLTHWQCNAHPDGGWVASLTFLTISETARNEAGVNPLRDMYRLDDDGRVIDYARVSGFGPLPTDQHGLDFLNTEIDKQSFTPLFALNLLNCRNVVLVSEPSRSRPLARRIARTGVTVSEIHVLPGTTARKAGGESRTLPADALPLHSVRGHFAEYGTNGKGLLFGRIAGRFWIPQHVRGDATVGIVEQSYVVES